MATVFVIDDDPGYRALLRALLEDKGHLVAESHNGADVLRYVENMKHPPALFIVDLKMPVVGGYELVRQLRHHEITREIPILMLTAQGEGVRDLAEQEGVVYLRKVVTSNEEIMDHVQRLLQRSAKADH